MSAPVLVFAIGNESRGDDALAPLLVRELQAEGMPDQIEVIEEYQLQIENAADLAGRQAVLFIDADMSCDAPCQLSAITANRDNSYTSHAMTPFSLLHAFRQVYEQEAPDSFLLRIKGYGFELGDGLSDQAVANMIQAKKKVRAWLKEIWGVADGLS